METQEGSTTSLLLDRVTRLVEVERSLTEVIEEAQPWLPSGTARPLPSSMEEVHQVLHLARNLASRTSAPAGWNPYAPVIGFTTPNPLPHQLRGGSLGGLQLEMARKHQQEEKMAVLEKKREREEAKKKEETQSNSNVHTPQNAKRPATGARKLSTSKQQQRPRQPVKMADMNLSDSDSSSEEDESEEEE